MNKLLLGIDGGGSKTQFAIATIDGKLVYDNVVQKGTNPKKLRRGMDESLETLSQGIGQIPEELLTKVVAGHAGIAGCNGGDADILAYIQERLPCVEISTGGDLDTSLRTFGLREGVLAIAGSGSARAVFHGGGMKVDDSIAVGGRALGHQIIDQALEASTPESIRKSVLHQAGVDPERYNLTDILRNPKTITLPEFISKNPELADYFSPLCIAAASLWAHAIHSGMATYRRNSDKEDVDIVLAGGLWKFDTIRDIVTEEVRNDDRITVHYNPSKPPVFGAIAIAKDTYEKAK